MTTKDQYDPVSAQPMLDAEYKAGKASQYLHAFEELRPGDTVLICTCVSYSDRATAHHNNLNDQWRNLSRHVKAKGAKVVGVKPYIGSRKYPDWISEAVRKARRRGAKWLLFESTDRAIRNRWFHSKKRHTLQATEDQLRELALLTQSVPVMTHLHPDASPVEVASYRIKRGQSAKGKVGGRPAYKGPGYKIRTRERLRPRAIQLHKEDWSVRGISEELNVPKSTIYDWVKDAK